MVNKNKYEKVLIFQYGKVGSSSLRHSKNGKYYPVIEETYKEYMLQTHSHDVAKDILSKYKNVLIINIVRFPINRNLSAFYENIKNLCPNYNKININEINQRYEEIYSVKNNDKWMYDFFKMFDIDIDNFNFDKIKKYNILTHNGNDILLFRFEDFEYITSKILPKYNIFVNGKKNISTEKFYSEIYKTHKKNYKIPDCEKENIINSKIINIYYSNDEINAYIAPFK